MEQKSYPNLFSFTRKVVRASRKAQKDLERSLAEMKDRSPDGVMVRGIVSTSKDLEEAKTEGRETFQHQFENETTVRVSITEEVEVCEQQCDELKSNIVHHEEKLKSYQNQHNEANQSDIWRDKILCFLLGGMLLAIVVAELRLINEALILTSGVLVRTDFWAVVERFATGAMLFILVQSIKLSGHGRWIKARMSRVSFWIALVSGTVFVLSLVDFFSTIQSMHQIAGFYEGISSNLNSVIRVVSGLLLTMCSSMLITLKLDQILSGPLRFFKPGPIRRIVKEQKRMRKAQVRCVKTLNEWKKLRSGYDAKLETFLDQCRVVIIQSWIDQFGSANHPNPAFQADEKTNTVARLNPPTDLRGIGMN